MPLSEILDIGRQIDQLTWTESNLDPFFYELVAIEEAIVHKTLKLGDAYFDRLQENHLSDSEFDERLEIAVIFTYNAVDDVVSYLSLWQSIFFELHKVYLLRKDGLVSSEQLIAFFDKSRSVLVQSFADIVSSAKKQLEDKQVSDLLRLQNPWPVYRKQITRLHKQALYLLKNYRVNYSVLLRLKAIQTILKDAVDASELELNELSSAVEDIERHILSEAEKHDSKQIARFLEYLRKIEADMSFKSHIEAFNSSLEKEVDQLQGQTEYALKVEAGTVYTRDINYKNRLRNWLNREIQPYLSEMWELVEVNSNGLKMTLRNMTGILNNTDESLSETDRQVLLDGMTSFVKPFELNIQKGKSFFEELRYKLEKRIEADLKISLMFDLSTYFLTSGAERDAYLVESKGKQLLKSLIARTKKVVERFRIVKSKIEREQFYSYKEKIIRFIQDREIGQENGQYNNFFITNGYYGDAFLVPRVQERHQISQVIANWKKGFRGSALITGHRLSGKTMFGESIASEFFREKTIRLSPGQTIGKSKSFLSLDYNLERALNYVVGHFMNDLMLIWIDDLELWWDDKYTPAANIKALSRFIDQYSDKFFIMVSMNMATRNYFSDIMPFGKVFQSQIYMKPLNFKQTAEALKLRHFAAQKTMLARKRQTHAAPAELHTFIRKIHRISNGNIGHTLALWACYVERASEHEVRFRFTTRFHLPDFLTPNTALVLSYIYLQKRTTEYRLRRMFGPAFNGIYADMVKRMLGVGILVRNYDGRIEINELVLPELADFLHKKQYIRNQYIKTKND